MLLTFLEPPTFSKIAVPTNIVSKEDFFTLLIISKGFENLNVSFEKKSKRLQTHRTYARKAGLDVPNPRVSVRTCKYGF